MYLTRHTSAAGPRWAADGQYLNAGFTLAALLALPAAEMNACLAQAATAAPATAPLHE